jgi:hypothetical protein
MRCELRGLSGGDLILEILREWIFDSRKIWHAEITFRWGDSALFCVISPSGAKG